MKKIENSKDLLSFLLECEEAREWGEPSEEQLYFSELVDIIRGKSSTCIEGFSEYLVSLGLLKY